MTATYRSMKAQPLRSTRPLTCGCNMFNPTPKPPLKPFAKTLEEKCHPLEMLHVASASNTTSIALRDIFVYRSMVRSLERSKSAWQPNAYPRGVVQQDGSQALEVCRGSRRSDGLRCSADI
jgi:hypothetical protein